MAAKNIRSFYDQNINYIDDILSTGDITSYYYSDGFEFYKEAKLTDALFTLGNHDGATVDGPNKEGSADWNGIGNLGSYNAFYKPYIEDWDVVQPHNADLDGLCYFHKDYDDSKIRLISLDSVIHFDDSYKTNQLNWLNNLLDELLNSNSDYYGYTLMVMSHYVPGNFTIDDIIIDERTGNRTTFHAYVMDSLTADSRFELDPLYASAVNDFVDNGGKFSIWLTGHYHTDMFFRPTQYPNLLTSSLNQSGRNAPFPSRVPNQDYRLGNTNQHVANIVTIDTINGLVKIIRAGSNMDKFMRNINVLSYDYINKKVIANF